jgi:hypothetical protein
MSIEAMKQAVEAFEHIKKYVTDDGAMPENWDAYHEKEYFALEALRQAIEQAEKQEKLCKYCGGIGRVVCDGRCMPEQKPVAWMYIEPDNEFKTVHIDDCDYSQFPNDEWFPVYTAPNMSTKPEKIDTSAERVHETDKSVHDDDDIQEYKRPWVGLTDDEAHKIIDDCTSDEAELEELIGFSIAILVVEAKLKEKNNG